jgi:hypothetical protein
VVVTNLIITHKAKGQLHLESEKSVTPQEKKAGYQNFNISIDYISRLGVGRRADDTLCKKITAAKSEEMKTGSNLAESPKED